MTIKKVVVIGAGTMGGGIAAHCANNGLSVRLLDIATKEGDKNALVKTLWEKQTQLRPAALMHPDASKRVTLGNLDEDLEAAIKDADWIVEVIIEQLEPKQQLMSRIDTLRKPGSIVSSNTSGIPIHKIAEGRSADFKKHFLGTHFFNPPRYLQLLEVIPTADTDKTTLNEITQFAENVLGKSVVVCKDTPNFIANRVGVFIGQYRTIAALDNGFSVEEVDALTGPVIGNPKSGTFRLSDIVGIDVWAHVTHNLHELAPNDESRDIFKLPAVVDKMLTNKWLGNKSSQGFYKEMKQADGSKEFWHLNPSTMEYEKPSKPRFDVIGETKELELPERLKEIFNNKKWQEDRGGQYLIETTLPILAYAARRVPEIADTPYEIDRAMTLGFAAELGPFEIWDALGVKHGAEMMKLRDIAVPSWVEEMVASGANSFYQTVDGKRAGVYSPETKGYVQIQQHRFAINLNEASHTHREVKRNASASLLDLGDGALCLEFHSKGNTLDPYSFDIMRAAQDALHTDQWKALVIANQGKDFSLGANIGMFIMGMGDMKQLDKMAKDMQHTILAFRFMPKPVVAAPRQRVLGGGTEVCLAAHRMVMAAETYMGLPEIGVGIIPAWGGCKELLRRNVSPHMTADKIDALEFLQKVFETVAYAKIGESAQQVKANGFLDVNDVIVASDEQLIGAAKAIAIGMADVGFTPNPRGGKPIYAIGRRGKAAMNMAVDTLRWGKFISAHDALIAKKVAHVLCGGDLTSPTWVSEEYILDLEREAALSLLGEAKTQERITYMLKNGKPLRN